MKVTLSKNKNYPQGFYKTSSNVIYVGIKMIDDQNIEVDILETEYDKQPISHSMTLIKTYKISNGRAASELLAQIFKMCEDSKTAKEFINKIK